MADDVPHIVVTPNFTGTALDRTGSTVTVITAAEIARSPTESVAQLLRTVPGVTVTETGGVGGQTLVSIRGAQAQHTLVLIDGIRVNDPASARDEFDFSVFSITDIERIEILRGPQSALYGSDAIGGVINIITRKSGGPTRVSGTIEGGSYGTRRANVSAGGGSGPFSIYASGTYFAADGFSRVGDRDHGEPDGTEKFAGTVRGAFELLNGGKFEFGGEAYRQSSETDASATRDAPGYVSDRTLLSGFGKLTLPSGDGRLLHTINAFATETTRFFVEPKLDTDYRGTDIGAEYQGLLNLGNAVSLLGGFRFEQQTAYQKKSTASKPAFDDTSYLYAGYLLYQLPVGNRTDLTFAGRYDGEVDGDGFLTGRATAVYEIPELEGRLRGSFGSGAKRPTAFQLSYNPDLVPEMSLGGDLGYEQSLLDGLVTFTATGFWNRIDDMIDFDPVAYSYANIDKVRTAGLELAATAIVVPGKLRMNGTYTYLDAVDLTTGLPLARKPQNSGSLTVIYTGIRNLEASLTATFVGPRFNDDAAKVPLDPYTRIDLAANYRVNGNLLVFGRIENLLDADYEDADGYNSAGFSAYVGLKWSN